ncbi:hypothetical protein DFH08DRAFT_874755 [Mycena albidolilacea]|uniref:Uncharacterized protein n=1 Tax=Mycena albidolilacea TaxID=1033008 RepID=A0AAD7EGP4_9AGAR|nr:hypothetical protein DFH08DRAFT_887747 [Mycena albidolilacea]KAJ7342680.1 hypothetical protein DFH08DRAFT_874755 [Mycena albidolilacea]
MTRATELLSQLKAAIDNIPDGIAAGRRDGLLAKTLTPKYTDDDPPIAVFPSDAKDGNYAAFSNQWERVFQLKSSTDLPESKYPLVCRGKHGLILAHAWATHYLTLDSVTASDVEMMLPRVEALLRLIPAAIKAYEEKARNPLRMCIIQSLASAKGLTGRKC